MAAPGIRPMRTGGSRKMKDSHRPGRELPQLVDTFRNLPILNARPLSLPEHAGDRDAGINAA
jgi:hypothetical protein